MDLFLKACGAAGPLQLEIEDRENPEGRCQTLPHLFALVGRDSRADVILDHETVSRRHAYLQMIAGHLFCVDLESRTGIRWEGTAGESGWIECGRKIEIGPYRIGLGSGDLDEPGGPADSVDPSNPLEPWSPDRAQSPGVVLEVLNRNSGPPQWQMNRALALVGRSPRCKLHLSDPSVSRFHCSLLHTPAGAWAIDLLGRGGIQVNGTQVRHARLGNGDELRVGNFLIRVRYEAPLSLAPPLRLAGMPALLRANLLPATRSTVAGGKPALSVWGLSSQELLRRTAARQAPEQAELVESLVAPLIDQFGMMQEKMFENFEQLIINMFQMFGAMHQDQMRLVQGELDQIRRLSQELQALQSESPRQRAVPASHATASAPGSPSDRDATTRAAASQMGLQSPPCPVPAGDASSKAAQLGTSPHQEGSPVAPDQGRRVDTRQETKSSAVRGRVEEAKGNPAPSEAKQAGERPAEQSDAYIHALLCQRIVEIQNERRTRWQKILNMVMGN